MRHSRINVTNQNEFPLNPSDFHYLHRNHPKTLNILNVLNSTVDSNSSLPSDSSRNKLASQFNVSNQKKSTTVLPTYCASYLGTLSKRHTKCLPFNCECQKNKLFSKKTVGAVLLGKQTRDLGVKKRSTLRISLKTLECLIIKFIIFNDGRICIPLCRKQKEQRK